MDWMKEDSYRWTINVSCVGKKENQRMLKRLQELGYTYLSGQPVDPEKIYYSFRTIDDDDRKAKGARYSVDEETKIVSYSNMYAMMNHHRHGNTIMYTVDEFLAMTEDQLPKETSSATD